jgi:hypothetical protein
MVVVGVVLVLVDAAGAQVVDVPDVGVVLVGVVVPVVGVVVPVVGVVVSVVGVVLVADVVDSPEVELSAGPVVSVVTDPPTVESVPSETY